MLNDTTNPAIESSPRCDTRSLAWLTSAIIAIVAVAPVAKAVDGISEISEICALQTGCFSGDAAGFPVTISAPGSYRLTSNIGSLPNANTDAISVTADGVTIDLNGFEIVGPVTCSGLGSAVACGPVGSGVGIDGPASDQLTVKMGRVRGFARHGINAAARAQIRHVTVESNGGSGISVGARSRVSESTAYQNQSSGIVAGTSSIVERSAVSSNGLSGIDAASGSSVIGCAAYDNGLHGIDANFGSVIRDSAAHQNEADGIAAGSGSQVSDNVAYQNAGDGIFASFDSSVQRNTVRINGGFGLNLQADTAYTENTINGNTAGTVDTGLNMGANSCNSTTTCP